MIAEVSYPSTGQGIEIGWANASNVPIICIYRSGMGPSGALRFISNQIVEYSSPDDMVAKLRSIIADHA